MRVSGGWYRWFYILLARIIAYIKLAYNTGSEESCDRPNHLLGRSPSLWRQIARAAVYIWTNNF